MGTQEKKASSDVTFTQNYFFLQENKKHSKD